MRPVIATEPGGPEVLRTAEVDDRDLDANRERYFRESSLKLPATRTMHPPRPIRGTLMCC